ncbi:MAG: biopolymer transporter ExbD [Acidimicrobiia bacterium]|nr:biopolymer transporter ExbD [Acidimicrobiia bacterium]
MRSVERSNQELKSEINITPMIDILLVLLIIFMVLSPSLSVGLDSQIPRPGSEPNQSVTERAIVVSLESRLSLRINQEPVPVAELQARLAAILKSRKDRSVFFQADLDLPFEVVAATIDIAKQAGAERVGLLTNKLAPANPAKRHQLLTTSLPSA